MNLLFIFNVKLNELIFLGFRYKYFIDFKNNDIIFNFKASLV